MDPQLPEKLKALVERYDALSRPFDLAGKRARHDALEKRMVAPDFWDDREKAQRIVNELKSLKAIIEPLEVLASDVEDLHVLAELAHEDPAAEAELAGELDKAEKAVAQSEFQQMLNGPDDRRNAYLSIHAGAGGTESCDWVEMLLRMYLRWADRKNFKVDIIEATAGEEAGLRRTTVHVAGPWAYGYLKAEIGVHRLVRISPFDANKRRHTSFASVDVTPELGEAPDIEIKDSELRIDTYRASGAGGQHVNKTDSAVRVTHLPTGIVVQCQNDRSQHRNRHTAMKMLMAKLHALRDAEQRAEMAAAYDAKGEIAFGYQIRSYVLQPYQLVKDLRTGAETGNVEAVLDGDIQPFIEAYLRKTVTKNGKSGQGGQR